MRAFVVNLPIQFFSNILLRSIINNKYMIRSMINIRNDKSDTGKKILKALIKC